MSRQSFKPALYEQFARIGHAVSAPKRIELLDLIAQGEQTVETLAEQSATPLKNTSAHLRALRAARLVDTRREGTYVYYRLASESVVRLLRMLQAVGRERLAEVEQVATLYISGRDELEPVSLMELRRRVKAGDATVIDVRPAAEYAAGHIPGAISIPVRELTHRLAEIPTGRDVVAYCRGPYCVYAVEAVAILRRRGFQARRAEEGLPDWRVAGYPVAADVDSATSRAAQP